MSNPKQPYSRPGSRRVGNPPNPGENASIGKTIFWAGLVSVGTVIGAKLVERLIEGPKRASANQRIDDMAQVLAGMDTRLTDVSARIEALEISSAARPLAAATTPKAIQGGEALARLLALPGGFEGD